MLENEGIEKKFVPDRSGWLVLSGLSAGNLILTALLFGSGEPAFQRFFGAANPILLFRIVYYLIWHIAWGHARLGLLF